MTHDRIPLSIRLPQRGATLISVLLALGLSVSVISGALWVQREIEIASLREKAARNGADQMQNLVVAARLWSETQDPASLERINALTVPELYSRGANIAPSSRPGITPLGEPIVILVAAIPTSTGTKTLSIAVVAGDDASSEKMRKLGIRDQTQRQSFQRRILGLMPRESSVQSILLPPAGVASIQGHSSLMEAAAGARPRIVALWQSNPRTTGLQITEADRNTIRDAELRAILVARQALR